MPDVLALDPDGKLVVIELKRDKADSTTDLQAGRLIPEIDITLPDFDVSDLWS